MSSSLAQRYRAVRARTEALCEPLSAEDQLLQSMPDASPIKWHIAHTSWFFERFVLSGAVSDYTPFDPRYDYLFNSYYVSVGKMQPRTERGLLSRPPLRDVQAYRRRIDAQMSDLLEALDPLSTTAAVVEVGLAHEQQHQELMLTDIKHAFASQPMQPSYAAQDSEPAEGPALADRAVFIHYDGGLEHVGHEGSGFAFDNEGPSHRVFVAPFALCSRLVTWGEYLAFMEDGGYRRPELWLSDGWNFVARQSQRSPLYLDLTEGSAPENAALFTLYGPRPLRLDEPVSHLSYFEADAYARWAGARLPTEFEWELATKLATAPVEGTLEALHPRAAQASSSASGLSEGTLQQLFGDVWEWTSSAYAAYPGFVPAAGSLGEYNGKFMCGQFVLRGGSCATPRDHVRATYRNFFPPTARWQFSGLRLAKSP